MEDDKLKVMSSWYKKASRSSISEGDPIRGFTPTGDFFVSKVKKAKMGPKDVPIILTEDGHKTDISLIRNDNTSWPQKKTKRRCNIRYSYCGRLWNGEADVAEGDPIVEVTHTDPMAGMPFLVKIPVANVMSVVPK